MKILIFYALTGGGHKRAAAALKEKINSLSPETEVETIDAFKEIGRLYDRTICGGYYVMATKFPKLYGFSYKITDRKNLVNKIVMDTNRLVSRKLLGLIENFKPDVIIACHPFISGMLAKLKRKGETGKAKIISLITDYDSHRTYISPEIDAFVLAEPQMAKKLVSDYNVNPETIYPLGIPIFDAFTEKTDKNQICKKEGLDPDKPTVLFMAGSFGVTDVLDFYKELALKGSKMQFIMITGKNRKLYDKLENLTESLGTKANTKLLYFVENVQDYMHISDIIVTKPGGLTVTESLACHLPMAIYSAFPGQERDNSVFLTEQNAAVLLDKDKGADEIISLLGSKDKLSAMKESCGRLSMPDSAEKIFRLALKLASEKND